MDNKNSSVQETAWRLPLIGFGTWQLLPGGRTRALVDLALKAGYRLIDTARIYGNERAVGQAVRESGIRRTDICVTTKLWASGRGYEHAQKAFEASRQRLGLDFIDLYLIHWPASGARLEAWRALLDLKAAGLAKAVGVSNYFQHHLEEIKAAKLALPTVNQVELHVFNYREQRRLIDYCQDNQIQIEAYSPLNHGEQMNHPVLTSIAQSHQRRPAQIMLRWCIEHGTVPIPKSSHAARLRENLQVTDFSLSPAEMASLDAISGA